MAPSRIVQLASLIQEHTRKVDDYIDANELPSPSFETSCPAHLILPPDIQVSQSKVLEAKDELNMLMLGPLRYVASQSVRRLLLLSSHY